MNYRSDHVYNRLEFDDEKWTQYINHVCFYNPKPIPIEMETMFLNRYKRNIGKLWVPVIYPITFKSLQLHDQRQILFLNRKQFVIVSEFSRSFLVEGFLSEFEYMKLFDWTSNRTLEYHPSEFLLCIREYVQYPKTYCIQLYPVIL